MFSFASIVFEELFDEIDVGKNHAAAAVALETDLVEGLSFFFAFTENGHVLLPQVARDLAARKATDGNNHLGDSRVFVLFRRTRDHGLIATEARKGKVRLS